MIHLIDATNAHLYSSELAAFHEERRRCFIEERGWDLSELNGREYDAYDDAKAVYLIGFSKDRRLEVACRLRPTADGGVLPDIFPHLIAPHEPPPARPGTWECTRYLAAPDRRGRAGFNARSSLHLAMVEHVRDRGGDRLLGFVDLPFLTHLRRFSGLCIRPVGLPHAYAEGGTTIAFEIGVTPDDLEQTRHRLRLPGRQLFVAPPWLPAGTDVFALERSVRLLTAEDAPVRQKFDRFTRRLAACVSEPDQGEVIMEALAKAA